MKFAGLTLSVLLLCPSVVAGQCKPVPADALISVPKGRSLGIRLFSIGSRYLFRSDTGEAFYKDEPLDNLRAALAEKLREQLIQLSHFSSVEILSDENPSHHDFLLEGEFTAIYQIYGKVQPIAYPVSRMAIDARSEQRDSGDTRVFVSEFAGGQAHQSAKEADACEYHLLQLRAIVEKRLELKAITIFQPGALVS